jgi:hypothetical protein
MLRACQARQQHAPQQPRSTALATPNYSYEKRQRELAKKRKAEEKKQKKTHRDGDATSGPADNTDPVNPGTPPAPPAN